MNRRTFIGAVGAAATGVAVGGHRLFAQAAPVEPKCYYLHAYTHRLDIERGFKLHCLVPRVEGDLCGVAEYAGFHTLRVGEEPWVFVGDLPPEQTEVPRALADLHRGRFGLRRQTAGGTVKSSVTWDTTLLGVLLHAIVEWGREDAVTGALLGWTWAERTAPTEWVLAGETLWRTEGTELALPARSPIVCFYDGHGPFTGMVAFASPPERLWVDDDGLYWSWDRVSAGGANVLPRVAYRLAAGRLDAQMLRLLSAPPEPDTLDPTVDLLPGETPIIRVKPRLGGVAVMPPTLATVADDFAHAPMIACPAGTLVLLAEADEAACALPVPPELEQPLPKTGPVPDDVRGEVARHVEDVLAHRSPDGRFTFSEGRTFYDGFVCAALAQVLPLLEPPVRDEARQAVEACLTYLGGHHVRSAAYGLLVPPEMPSFIESAVDYPEITSCYLYGMLAYALAVDRDYPRAFAGVIRTHFDQIWEMTTPCGTAYAAADASRVHVIAESAVGGYLAWASMYHLEKLLGDADLAARSRARAALAWAGYRELFRWRPEFGESGVVNGWADWRAQIRVPEPWAYVQTTWFSFIPLIPCEREDRYGLWRALREQPWWTWTAGPPPKQRAYDYANALALARAGYPEEVRTHWAEVADRPFSWETFDYTPVLALAALPQLAALGALP